MYGNLHVRVTCLHAQGHIRRARACMPGSIDSIAYAPAHGLGQSLSTVYMLVRSFSDFPQYNRAQRRPLFCKVQTSCAQLAHSHSQVLHVHMFFFS